MSTSTQLSSLTQWVEHNIRALYLASSESALDTALAAFLSKNVQILLNGAETTYAEYKAFLLAQRIITDKAEVTFYKSVEAQSNTKPALVQGSVGVFFDAVVFRKIAIDAILRARVTTSLNVVVEQLLGHKGEHHEHGGDLFPPLGGKFVVKLTQVTTETPDQGEPVSN